MGSFTCQVLAILVGLSANNLLKNYRRNSLFFSDANITLPAFFSIACAAILVLGGLLGCCLSKDLPWMQGMVRCCAAWLQYLCIRASRRQFERSSPPQFVYLLVVVFCLKSTSSALAYFQSTTVCVLYCVFHLEKKNGLHKHLCIIFFMWTSQFEASLRVSAPKWNIHELHWEQSGLPLTGCRFHAKRGESTLSTDCKPPPLPPPPKKTLLV